MLRALSTIIDPDFGMSVVDCGFIKDLSIDPGAGAVAFRMELTTPACPIKGEFEEQASGASVRAWCVRASVCACCKRPGWHPHTTRPSPTHAQARARVGALPWVRSVDVRMDARPPAPLLPDDARPSGLRDVSHVIAVSSCKGGACARAAGQAAWLLLLLPPRAHPPPHSHPHKPTRAPPCAGVGKSTTAVNLAYTLAQMGARVGIFDADIYGEWWWGGVVRVATTAPCCCRCLLLTRAAAACAAPTPFLALPPPPAGPSLPTMISPELRVLQMDPDTKVGSACWWVGGGRMDGPRGPPPPPLPPTHTRPHAPPPTHTPHTRRPSPL